MAYFCKKIKVALGMAFKGVDRGADMACHVSIL